MRDTDGDARREAVPGERGFGAWLDAMQRHGNSVNVGSFLGAATVRAYAKGRRRARRPPPQLDTMRRVRATRCRMARSASRARSSIRRAPTRGTHELIEMAKAMAPYHGVYITHMRSEGDSLLEAMDEAFAIGREGGVPLEIYHLKAAGASQLGQGGRDGARRSTRRARPGTMSGATMYPYPASGNDLARACRRGRAENGKLLDNLRDPRRRARIVRERWTRHRGGPCTARSRDRGPIMVVGLLSKPENAKYEGWRLDEIADDMHKSWAEAMADIVLTSGGRAGKINFSMTDENVAMQLQAAVGGDRHRRGGLDPDSAQGLTHPRAYGTYPRMLGKYVREEHVLTLEDAVRKMTSGVAARLALRDRGLLREGMFADIVVFDPATIIDHATYEKPHQLSIGRAGCVREWRRGGEGRRRTGAKPGRALRGAGYGMK